MDRVKGSLPSKTSSVTPCANHRASGFRYECTGAILHFAPVHPRDSYHYDSMVPYHAASYFEPTGKSDKIQPAGP